MGILSKKKKLTNYGIANFWDMSMTLSIIYKNTQTRDDEDDSYNCPITGGFNDFN